MSGPYIINRSLSDKYNTMNTLEKRLLSLQHQLQQLNNDVSNLIALTSPSPPTTNRADVAKDRVSQFAEPDSKPAVGLNRYRQLGTNEQPDRNVDHPERHLVRNR